MRIHHNAGEAGDTLPAVSTLHNNQIKPQVVLIDQTTAVVGTYMRRVGVVGLDAHCHLSEVRLLGSWIHFSPVMFLFLLQCENWND